MPPTPHPSQRRQAIQERLPQRHNQLGKKVDPRLDQPDSMA